MSYALVTGASKGIGKAIAEELAKSGKNLLLVARSEALLREFAGELQRKYKIQANYFAFDLSDPSAPRRVRSWIDDNKYSLSILVNNAGYAVWGNFDQLSWKEQHEMMQVNVLSLLELTHLLLPLLKKNNHKSYVLNVSSTTAYQAIPCISMYAASKAFVLSFSRGLRYELRKSNVSVTCLSPGSTSTNFIERAKMQALQATAEKFSMDPSKVAKVGLKAMYKGKAEVIPGFVNKLTAAAAAYLPKSLLEDIAAGIYEKYLKQ